MTERQFIFLIDSAQGRKAIVNNSITHVVTAVIGRRIPRFSERHRFHAQEITNEGDHFLFTRREPEFWSGLGF